MTLKMSEIINFNYFYDEVRTQKLPLKVLFKLSNLSKAIEEKSEFYREKFQEILSEYGEKDENGQLVPTDDGRGVKIIAGKEKECFDKVNELQNLEVELSDVVFDVDEFGDIEMTMEVFGLIKPFLK